MDKNILKSATDKKFTEFSNAVKQELKNKLANNPTVKQYVSDFDKIQSMKQSFAKINSEFSSKELNSTSEPEEE